MALGGMLTATAVVIMCLGSLIPVNTYVCPVLCILITRVVLERCGRRIGWCYYIATAILSLMLAPDREAALVYAFLGYYPMIRPFFEKLGAFAWYAKLLLFTLAGGASYGMLLLVMGAGAAMNEGWVLTVVTVLLWDALFLLTDRLLGVPLKKR
jgi:hypothetical protein